MRSLMRLFPGVSLSHGSLLCGTSLGISDLSSFTVGCRETSLHAKQVPQAPMARPLLTPLKEGYEYLDLVKNSYGPSTKF